MHTFLYCRVPQFENVELIYFQVLTEDSKMEGNGVYDSKVLSSNSQISHKTKTVGQSKFYDVVSSAVTPEKQDIMKPDDFNEEGMNKIIINLT